MLRADGESCFAAHCSPRDSARRRSAKKKPTSRPRDGPLGFHSTDRQTVMVPPILAETVSVGRRRSNTFWNSIHLFTRRPPQRNMRVWLDGLLVAPREPGYESPDGQRVVGGLFLFSTSARHGPAAASRSDFANEHSNSPNRR